MARKSKLMKNLLLVIVGALVLAGGIVLFATGPSTPFAIAETSNEWRFIDSVRNCEDQSLISGCTVVEMDNDVFEGDDFEFAVYMPQRNLGEVGNGFMLVIDDNIALYNEPDFINSKPHGIWDVRKALFNPLEKDTKGNFLLDNSIRTEGCPATEGMENIYTTKEVISTGGMRFSAPLKNFKLPTDNLASGIHTLKLYRFSAPGNRWSRVKSICDQAETVTQDNIIANWDNQNAGSKLTASAIFNIRAKPCEIGVNEMPAAHVFKSSDVMSADNTAFPFIRACGDLTFKQDNNINQIVTDPQTAKLLNDGNSKIVEPGVLYVVYYVTPVIESARCDTGKVFYENTIKECDTIGIAHPCTGRWNDEGLCITESFDNCPSGLQWSDDKQACAVPGCLEGTWWNDFEKECLRVNDACRNQFMPSGFYNIPTDECMAGGGAVAQCLWTGLEPEAEQLDGFSYAGCRVDNDCPFGYECAEQDSSVSRESCINIGLDVDPNVFYGDDIDRCRYPKQDAQCTSDEEQVATVFCAPGRIPACNGTQEFDDGFCTADPFVVARCTALDAVLLDQGTQDIEDDQCKSPGKCQIFGGTEIFDEKLNQTFCIEDAFVQRTPCLRNENVIELSNGSIECEERVEVSEPPTDDIRDLLSLRTIGLILGGAVVIAIGIIAFAFIRRRK